MNSDSVNSAACAPAGVVLPLCPPAARGIADDREQMRWFEEEIQTHERELRAYLRGRFPSLHDIDDLVQETYARILRARALGKASLTRAYLFVTARNAALDQLRRKRPASLEAIAEIECLAVVEERPDAAESASHDQELEILAQAIAMLPARCREIFILRRYHDLSHKEIARRLAIAENTVNAQLVTGMLRCRAYLRARGVTPERSDALPPTLTGGPGAVPLPPASNARPPTGSSGATADSPRRKPTSSSNGYAQTSGMPPPLPISTLLGKRSRPPAIA